MAISVELGKKPKAPDIKVGGVTLAEVLAAARKEKGDKIAQKGSDIPQVKRIPTGAFEFDLAIGGGFPRGRYSIIYGPEGATKTNHCYLAIAQAQKMPAPNNKAVLVDLEGTFDADWAKQWGVDVEALIVIKPGYGEEACDLVDAVMRADDVLIVVVDSLASLVPAKEIKKSMEEYDVGTASLMIKRMMNKVVVALGQEYMKGHEPCVIFINQTRYKIGVMFGDPETQPGGKSMLFWAALILRISGNNLMVKEISTDKPAFKEITLRIKKAKVPVTKYVSEYKIALLPSGFIKIGMTDSWNAVSGDLKQLGLLKQVSTGWTAFGKQAKTLAGLCDIYEKDNKFALQCQAAVINSYKAFYVEPEKETAPTTGPIPPVSTTI